MASKIEKRATKTVDRRYFLKLFGGAAGLACTGLVAACEGGYPPGRMGGEEPGRGRLLAKPDPRSPKSPADPGLRSLSLGPDRDALLYVPPGHGATSRLPLALTLHGAGGDAQSGISPFLELADKFGLILLSPNSRRETWDALTSNYGPDVKLIDRALERTFELLSVDTAHLAITGFSDGASYALSLGLTNGRLFTHVIAFSPGFMAPAQRRGEPCIFVSHGTQDKVLPIERTSQRLVPRLQQMDYVTRYREFDGPHTVPRPVAREALDWFVPNREAPP